MRPVPLTTQRGGINRLKVKGAARADSVYDLLNAYVTQAGTILPREGTIRRAVLNASSAGLMAMGGNLNIFSASALSSIPTGFVNNVLVDEGAPTIQFVPPSPVINPVYTVPTLLHFNDGNLSTAFTDSGQNPATWTPTGAVAESTDQSLAVGSGAIKFTAGNAANMIQAPIFNTALDIFTGDPDFTFEFWWYIQASQLVGGNVYRVLGYDWINNAGTTGFDFFQNGNQITIEGPSILSGTFPTISGALVAGWNHIAISKANRLFRLFVNGTNISGGSAVTGFMTGPFPAPVSTSKLSLGSTINTSATPVTNYISEVRVTKGRALYGAPFQLPGLTGAQFSLPFTTTGVFPYNVTNLLHFEDGGGSTLFTDAAGVTWTPAGAAAETTTQFKLGTGSGAFINAGDRISSSPTQAKLTDYTVSGGDPDFTIEMFLYPPQSIINDGNAHIFFDPTWLNGVGVRTLFSANVTGTSLKVLPQGLTAQTYANAFPTGNTWYHVAFVRKGDLLTTYVNGTSVGSVANFRNMPSMAGVAALWYMGTSPQNAFSGGYIDEFRAIKGVAAYVSNFTPPSQPYPIPSTLPNPITKIWFSKPFMGFPYVVAQFSNGDIRHFWLQSNGNWAANTVYKNGSIVLPNIGGVGLAMQAVRDMPPNPAWAPETIVTAGTVVEPNTYTGFAYRAVAVAGSNPHTGPSEPSWPTVIGGTIQEFGDFGITSTSAASTQSTSATAAQPLGQTITDRYGNASTILNANTATAGNASTAAVANTAVTTWTPGTNYSPGAVVRPTTNQGAVVNAIPNGDFEAGNDGNWTLSNGEVTIQSAGGQYQGNFCVKFALNHDTQTATMTNFGVVTPGQSVSASAYLNPNNNGTDTTMWLILNWYNSADVLIAQTPSTQTTSTPGSQEGFGYRKVTVTGSAPAGAAHVRVQIKSATGTNPNASFADLVTWNLAQPAATSNFLFEAVQSSVGVSAGTEPSWPTISGNTVIDNTVTWKAIGTSIVTWQAIPIMQSGATEPVWPVNVGITVVDGSTFTSSDGHVTNTNMSWKVISRMISDIKCPQTTPVALGASHVFNGNNDICSFSAVVNPTDWTSANNAGYLPTGLNNYGDNPIAVLALYRSNLVALNSGGYQMWQIDPDPQNMALLDAQPVGSVWPRAAQSVANDLLFLTEVGVRNLGVVGATANLAIGDTGQPVDPIVTAQMKTGLYTDPLSLYYPGRGQYWLIFGTQAFVLTVNGRMQKTWSRYVFPDTITDWTLLNGVLYMRTAGNNVWQLDSNTLMDDTLQTPVQAALATSVAGGTLAAGTYYYVVTATNANGETIASNEKSIVTTGTTSSNTVSWAAIPGATGYNIYRGTAPGAENVFYSVGNSVVNFVDTNAASSAGSPPTISTAGVKFNGVIQWPYLDIGVLGQHKQFEGLDIVGDGQVTIQIGWREDDVTTFNDNPGFGTSLNVTPPYTINAADTVPGTPIPIGPITSPSYTIILTFGSNQAWTWEASNLYVTDNKGGGAFG